MGLPKISIKFKSMAVSAIRRGDRGVVALILVDDGVAEGLYTVVGEGDIPVGLSVENIEQIKLAMIGGENAPKKIVICVQPIEAINHTVALGLLETVKFDYLAIPEIVGDSSVIVAWVKNARDNLEKRVKVVLANQPADYEGVINFTTDYIVVGGKTYTTIEYCSRIAGLLAGTPMTISATFTELPEVDDVERFTIAELDVKIQDGEFVLYNDGEKVKVGRAVTSLKTLSDAKGEDFKKTKIVDILDLIFDDVKRTSEDVYIGKYANNYDNKCLLISAINEYLLQLEADGILDVGVNRVDVDIPSQRLFLTSIGIDVEEMTDQEIKEANTKHYVFLTGTVKPLDAIEDIALNLFI